MIIGYAKNGYIERGGHVFDEMVHQKVV